MLFQPRRIKHKKTHKGHLYGISSSRKFLTFGNLGLQAVESAYITGKQIQTLRKITLKLLKKLGKLCINIFSDKALTARSKGTRMGAGKGSVAYWAAIVKKKTILLEIKCKNIKFGIKLLHSISEKLPIKTNILFKYVKQRINRSCNKQ